MIHLTVTPGAAFAGIFFLLIGALAIVRGLQMRFADVPGFVEDYRGWSCPTLALPFGGVFVLALGIYSFEEYLPLWFAMPFSLVAIGSFFVFMLGMLVWFPWFLLPGWYRRARKAGVPRHDPHAMARFKRLTKTQQRTTTWPNLPEPPRDETYSPSVESLDPGGHSSWEGKAPPVE